MNDVQFTGRLNELGLERWDIERLIKAKQLERVRRGAYAEPLPDAVPIEERHLRLLRATMPQLDPGAVVSHGSAAAMHGLPVWEPELGRVHVTRSRSGGGQRRSGLHLHVAPLLVGDIEMIDGYPVTSIVRTVLDQARTSPFQQAVAVADRALALGMRSPELDEGLERMARWPGVRKARRTCGFADGRSESVGESMSRVRFIEQELPTPTLQYEVYDERDSLIARSDFGWEDRGTLGEFDGKIKYGRLLKPGQRVEDVVYAEKRREDALRDRGWQVVRWTWEDLGHPEVIRDRLLRAFERADRSGIAPDNVRRCST